MTRAEIRAYPTRRVHLDRGGYDPSGRYWGACCRGVAPLYAVDTPDGDTLHVRSGDARGARAAVIAGRGTK